MRVEQIGSPRELEALMPEWAALWSSSPGATPFQRPEWLDAWWRSFAPGNELRVLAVRDAGGLAGLLPLFLFGEGASRRAALLGAGVSDYLDVIADAGRAEAVVAALWKHLGDGAGTWPPIELTDLPAGSPLLAVSPPAALRPQRALHALCPVVALPASFDALEAGLPSWLRRNLRQGQARLSRLGHTRWRQATPDSLAELLDAFFSLHAARWRSRGGPGVLASPAVQSFHRRAARGLLRSGLLRLHALEHRGTIAGVIYGMQARSVVYHYLSGFAPELGRCNLGALLVARLLGAAVEEGCTACDFLRGDESYKQAWGGSPRASWRLRLLS